MKGKISLEVAVDPPEVEYANDSFTHNEDLQPVNKIGTIRSQYDWKSLSDKSEWKIEPDIVEKIQPLINYINHAGVLRSTKVCNHTISWH